MRVWTYGEALDGVEADLDLVNETFLTADEKVSLFNKAIQKAAAEIQKLGVEDEYFTTNAALSLVSGTSRYALPTDIYANKIRSVIYKNGATLYPVNRVRRQNKHLVMADIDANGTGDDYQYDIENTSVDTGVRLRLCPPARETSAVVMTLFYVREPKAIPLVTGGTLAASRATRVDLPQFASYIFDEVKYQIAKKIPHPDLQTFKDDRDRERQLMVDTLTEMVVDDATEIEPDMSHYGESS